MNTFRTLPVLGLLALGLLLAACDNALETATTELSAADLALVSEIAAQSLSDADEGTMSDLNDLNASVGENGLGYGEGPVARHEGPQAPHHRAWRPENKRQRAVYDSTTGEHTVEYQRSFTSPMHSKELSVRLVYVFTDADGAFIARPRALRDAIDAIAFEGTRSGFTSGQRRNGDSRESRFAREATWNVAGVQSGTASFSGTQHDQGVFKMVRGDTTVERSYEARFRTENVTITRANADEGIEEAVTGQLVYAITMKKTVNGEAEDKVVEGTIELEGNGKALLRFLGTKQLYRIDLKSGDVRRG